jgi:predicted kinase
MKIIFLRGIPASGKSTWKNAFQANNPNFIAVNRDAIRYSMGGENYNYNRTNEKIVTECEMIQIEQAFYAEKDIIVDATNLNPSYLESYFVKFAEMAQKRHVDIEFSVHEFDIDVKTAKERNSKRIGIAKVPEHVIEKMHRQFKSDSDKWHSKFNWFVDNFNTLLKDNYHIKQDINLPPAVIFDIDGTLALNQGRSPYDGERVDEDMANQRVKDLLNIIKEYKYSIRIIICTGREDTGKCKEKTLKWLKYNKIHFDEFYIRKQSDHRADWVIKREFLHDISLKYNVLFVVDDRNQVVEKCWRRAGITCLQVESNGF